MTISIDLDEKQVKKEPRKVKLLLKKDSRSGFTAKTERLPEETGQKKKRKISWKKVITTTIIAIIIGALVYGGYYLYKVTKDIGFKFNPSEIVSEEDPELKRDSTGKYTSILILGVDTRSSGAESLESTRTDTIIIATYMYDTNELTMVSIPRDFFVEKVGNPGYFDKINGVYPAGGFEELEKTVKNVTGIEVQYHVMINFDAFVEIIDAVGGVTINVEEGFTDNFYPSEKGAPGSRYDCFTPDDVWGWWEVVSFPKGIQTMDGETALKYARSRHGSYSSGGGVTDYGRAAHQQQVVDAVRAAISNSDTYTNPQKFLSLISAVKDNIRISEFTIDDIKALLNLLDDFSKNKGETYSFVLDPSAGNSKLISSNPAQPKLGLGNYTDINDYILKILANPDFYEEDASIYVYDTGLGYQNTYKKILELEERYPYSDIKFMGTMYYDKEGIVVYEHETGSKPSTQKEFVEYLKPNLTVQPEYITTSLNGEDISIFFGKEISKEAATNE